MAARKGDSRSTLGDEGPLSHLQQGVAAGFGRFPEHKGVQFITVRALWPFGEGSTSLQKGNARGTLFLPRGSPPCAGHMCPLHRTRGTTAHSGTGPAASASTATPTTRTSAANSAAPPNADGPHR